MESEQKAKSKIKKLLNEQESLHLHLQQKHDSLNMDLSSTQKLLDQKDQTLKENLKEIKEAEAKSKEYSKEHSKMYVQIQAMIKEIDDLYKDKKELQEAKEESEKQLQ